MVSARSAVVPGVFPARMRAVGADDAPSSARTPVTSVPCATAARQIAVSIVPVPVAADAVVGMIVPRFITLRRFDHATLFRACCRTDYPDHRNLFHRGRPVRLVEVNARVDQATVTSRLLRWNSGFRLNINSVPKTVLTLPTRSQCSRKPLFSGAFIFT